MVLLGHVHGLLLHLDLRGKEFVLDLGLQLVDGADGVDVPTTEGQG